MKNLLNKGLDIERLELFPNRLRWRFMFDTKYNVKEDWRRYRWNNDTWSDVYHQCDAIIRGSVGENWNDIYSKLCKIINKLPFDISVSSVVNVHFCYWDTRRNEWWLRDYSRYSRPLASLDKYLNKLHGERYWRSEFLYVHPETNILCRVEPKSSPTPTKEQVRQNYEKKNARRKADRQHYKERRSKGINELKMINNRQLLDFYISLVKERDSLFKQLHAKPEAYPSPTEKKYDYKSRMYKTISVKNYNWLCLSWRIHERQRKANAIKAQAKYPIVQEQVERLERGDFGGYFSSNVYLYSLQKECHHFAQP